MFHTSFYYYYYLHLHLRWGDTDLSFVAICKSSLNKYAYNKAHRSWPENPMTEHVPLFIIQAIGM